MSVLQQTVSLAAQLRAFSSLLSLPSQAQSVIKAFRRQGIGSADEFNTARFFLSRLESLSASPTSLSFLRFAPSLPNLPRAGRVGRFAPNGETVSSTSFQPQTRLTLASALWPQWFLVDVCARAGKTLISRSNLCPSGSCRALRACPLWYLWPVFASAHADAKTVPKHHRPTHIRPLGPHHKCTLISRPTAVYHGYIYIESVRRYSCHFTALLPMCIRLT